MTISDSTLDCPAGEPCRPSLWILSGLAGATFLLHLLCIHRYGFFRDELYYMACGHHLAWGYVDQPPLVAAIAWVSRRMLGNSLFAIRFFPALAGAFLVFFTGWMAAKLGGGKFAQFLAALALLFAPVYLAFDSFLSMNAFEPIFWMLCVYLLIRMLQGGNSKLWLVFGAVAGLGLLNKHTMLVFGFAAIAGLLLTPERKLLASRWLWLGGLLALLIFLPNLLWEIRHGWPQIEVVRNAREFKNYPIGPLQFLAEQVLFLEPVALPLWAAGLAWLFFDREGKRYRALGWAFLVVLAVFIGLQGKSYYPVPAYPLLFAAGGVAFERYLAAARRRRWKWSYASLLTVFGIVALPFGAPVLPVQAFVRYSAIVPLARPVHIERDSFAKLPQLYADMFGWRSMVATVARVYHRLPPNEQSSCAILAGNYGEAGAVDFYGGAYGLPKAISGHNNYFLWGPRGYTGEVVIAFGFSRRQLDAWFGDVERAGTITDSYAMPVETNLPVYVCRRPRAPLPQLWPQLKTYI